MGCTGAFRMTQATSTSTGMPITAVPMKNTAERVDDTAGVAARGNYPLLPNEVILTRLLDGALAGAPQPDE